MKSVMDKGACCVWPELSAGQEQDSPGLFPDHLVSGSSTDR